MTRKRLLYFFGVLAAVGMVWADLGWGWRGAVGMALGLAGTSFSLGAGFLAIRLAGETVTSEPMVAIKKGEEAEETLRIPAAKARFANMLLTMTLLLKLPVVIGAGLVAARLGGQAPTTFLIGLGLVYSAMFGWALLQQ